jgi:4-cresol dehydrogenase (hydroxylating)
MGPLARVAIITDGLLDNGFRVMHALRFLPFARANAAAISAVRPLHGLALGVPTDVAIDNLLWKYGRSDLPAIRLDESNCGLVFISPALPPDGKVVVKILEGLKTVAARHGHVLYMTVNIETSSSLVAVINLLFDRSVPEEIEKAHRCAKAMLDYLHAHKLEIYRARADVMADVLSRDPQYWQTVRSLKQTFDPDNIMSPGRYNLPG